MDRCIKVRAAFFPPPVKHPKAGISAREAVKTSSSVLIRHLYVSTRHDSYEWSRDAR